MLPIFGRRGRLPFGSKSSPPPESLPLAAPIDEEQIPGYEPRYFYHANPGDVLNCRYELKAKIGWGSSSTVWLARDTRSGGWLEPSRYVVVKICACNSADVGHELDMSIHLSADSNHRGFGLESPAGSTHLSLVFEPMREPLWLFRRRLAGEDRVTPPWMPLIKTYLQILLEGLDYLHSECHVIHTDLKLDNILLTLEHQSIIEAFVEGQAIHPMARKRVDNRTVYRCHNDFGRINGDDALKKMYPKITDFGLAQRGDQPGPFLYPIQPNDCHAPEVLLGTGWSYSADIWNFGVMVWDLLGGKRLFQQEDPHSYSAVQHLADMVALLGPVPPVLVQRERDMRHWRWSPEAINPEGRLCSSAAEFYGGPFFNDDDFYSGL
ncbi:kinase-like domain-containing protein [Leptodontidium sp. 2 PMI_412]|nr:kinase-like domain-containing protein [Leptodontidium sp. 2 PMI_412]